MCNSHRRVGSKRDCLVRPMALMVAVRITMALKDLTSPAAVRAALAEYDQLGRDTFLERYGFGHAKAYFIQYEGQLYDSKAILGVAHGYQFPDAGPLLSRDFSGGKATVKPKLEALGFTFLEEQPP